MVREPESWVVDRGQLQTEAPITKPLVSRGFRGSPSRRPLPSHGRGHWFETSIAHPEKPLLSGGFLASGSSVGVVAFGGLIRPLRAERAAPRGQS